MEPETGPTGPVKIALGLGCAVQGLRVVGFRTYKVTLEWLGFKFMQGFGDLRLMVG